MAKPKLCLIPATIGDKVYSILPSDGVGDFDFTRASTATRINAQGLIEEVASGENRLNYSLLDGEVVGCPHLLLEDEATNSINYSEELNDSEWSTTRLDVLANQIISPDGTLNADLLTPTASANTHSIGNATLINYNSQESTISFFAKFNGYNISTSIAGTPTNWTGCVFDLENGVAKTPQNAGAQSLCTSKIENYGNGWYRCSITFTPYASGTFYNFWGTVDSTDANLGSFGLQSYTADGISGVYLWGCQAEVEQSYPTSYIKTTSAAVTRAAETCTNSGDANTFNDSEGVLMAEISALANDGTFRAIAISDGGILNRVVIDYDTGNGLRAFYAIGGGTTGRLFDINYDIKQISKVCFKYKENDFAIWVNGFELGSSNSGSVLSGSNFNNLNFNFGGSSGGEFYGNTKQLQYFDTALTDTDLEELTSWDSFRDMAEGQLYSIE